MTVERPELSLLIPVYNAAETINALVERLSAELDSLRIEFVLVNDGSSDDSDAVCRKLHEIYPNQLTYVKLARNFGEHNAVMAGLAQTTGEYVVIMDDDFQNPPEEVLKLHSAAREGSFDVVYSQYERKQHSPFRNLGSTLHNRMAVALIKKPRDLYLSSFKCLSRWLVKQVVGYTGPFPYLDGLIFRCTHNYGTVEVRHDER
ncbi:MAG: glycosyltransferase family 2 protein, partial [Lentisphaeria bacterium]|nr:glycosyltransferase family 2 protein [Lentisphaeria bacterium]